MVYIKSTVINKECLYKMGTFQKISRKADLFHLICCLKKRYKLFGVSVAACAKCV